MQNKIAHYLEKWQLILDGKQYSTDTSSIIFVSYKNQPAILKIATENSDENTASVLSHYQGNGAVTLLKHDGQAVLMQRAMPGTHLKDLVLAGKDDDATRIICGVIKKLHSNKEYQGEYRNIADWGKGFKRYIDSGDKEIAKDLVLKAEDQYFNLIESQSTPILLHGDLHHDNILLHQDSWIAIDPKGIIGEPEYEIGAMLRNPISNPEISKSQAVLESRIQIITDQLGYNPDRIKSWCFAQNVLSDIWFAEAGQLKETS